MSYIPMNKQYFETLKKAIKNKKKYSMAIAVLTELLSMSNHYETKTTNIRFSVIHEPGTTIFSFYQITECLGYSRKSVKTVLNQLEKLGILKIYSTKEYSKAIFSDYLGTSKLLDLNTTYNGNGTTEQQIKLQTEQQTELHNKEVYQILTKETELQTEQQTELLLNNNKQVINNINNRIENFKNEVFSFKTVYEINMLEEFFNYWSETNKREKMKWELENTWETSKRLSRWKNNQQNNNKRKINGLITGTNGKASTAVAQPSKSFNEENCKFN